MYNQFRSNYISIDHISVISQSEDKKKVLCTLCLGSWIDSKSLANHLKSAAHQKVTEALAAQQAQREAHQASLQVHSDSDHLSLNTIEPCGIAPISTHKSRPMSPAEEEMWTHYDDTCHERAQLEAQLREMWNGIAENDEREILLGNEQGDSEDWFSDIQQMGETDQSCC